MEGLKERGANIWIDLGIEGGTTFYREIEKALTDAAFILYILTEGSINSREVANEIAYGNEERKTIIPIKIQPKCKIPLPVKAAEYIDFTKNYDTAFIKLANALNLKISTPGEHLVQEKKATKGVPPNPIPVTKPAKTFLDPLRNQNRVSDLFATREKLLSQSYVANRAANPFSKTNTYYYEYTTDIVWWLLLPVAMVINTALVYFATMLFNYLISLANWNNMHYEFSWTIILITGCVWGVVSSIVAGSNASSRADLAGEYFMPFTNIIDPYDFADFLRGLFSALFINILFISFVGVLLAFAGFKYFKWDFNTVFLYAFIGINIISLVAFVNGDA
jgi:hypothetical protein